MVSIVFNKDSGKSRVSRSITPETTTAKLPRKEEAVSVIPAIKAARAIGSSLAPGEAAKYRHKTNAPPLSWSVVTVQRFAGPEMWEDTAADKVTNPLTKETSYPLSRVDSRDCLISPVAVSQGNYVPQSDRPFLFPVMALDSAYTREPEAA